MTDPLAFLQAAHARAEQAAQAATPGPWITGSGIPHLVNEVVYGQIAWATGNLQHTCDTTYSGKYAHPNAVHIALHDPAATLRRIAAERKILTEHPLDREASDDTWGYQACQTCLSDREGDPGYDWRPDGWPCVTIRALAEAWGWQEEEHHG